jgi:probable HAF family extracellular repeat protein
VKAFVGRSALLVLVLAALLVGVARGADGDVSSRAGAIRYQVTNLTPLGAAPSWGNSINNLGWIAGPSRLPGGAVQHAALWRPGSVEAKDLGTLGGTHSSVLWPVKNVRGVISGFAETGELDPLNERWSCSRFFPSRTGHVCLGFVWRNGQMRPLPTLGGPNGFATGANNFLQVVGWAEKAVLDPTCSAVDEQYRRFRAVLWGPGTNQTRELPPLPGHSASAATAINDLGQVVGISGRCDRAFGRFSAISAVLWKDGVPTDIGNLGGVAWNTPMAINLRGDIVGFSNVSADDGGTFNANGFLKLRGKPIQALRPLPGDLYSQALGINEWRQVVGLSCSEGFASCRAFLWQNGVMTNLNDVAPGYADYLYAANDINDFGQITGEAIEQGTGASVPFKASPLLLSFHAARRGAHVHVELPESVRLKLMARFGIRDADVGR